VKLWKGREEEDLTNVCFRAGLGAKESARRVLKPSRNRSTSPTHQLTNNEILSTMSHGHGAQGDLPFDPNDDRFDPDTKRCNRCTVKGYWGVSLVPMNRKLQQLSDF
jgi:hypothetical protein